MRWEDGRIVEVGPGRADAPPRGRRDPARLRQRALASRVRDLRRLRRRRCRSGRGSPTHIERKRALDAGGHARDRPPRRRRLAPRRDHDHRRLQLLGRRRDRRRRARAARDRLPRGVRRRSRGRAERQFDGEARRGRGDAARRASASRRTRRTPARSTTYRWCLSLGIPVGTHLAESANENEWLEHGTGAARRDRRSSSRRPGSAPSRRSSPCSAPTCSARTASRSRRTRSRCSPSATSRSRTARARTPCSAAASRRSPSCGRRASASASAPTRRPRRRRSTCSRRCARRLRRAGARAAPRRALADGRAAAGDARRGPRAATRRPGGYPDARQARRPDGRVARGKPLPSGRGSRGGSRLRRLTGTSARDDRRRRDPLPEGRRGQQWQEVRSTASAARRTNARAAPVAAPRTSRSRRKWQEQLFFQRLRVHAKWVFVLLALVFALGFVFFGVGSGSTGISDVLQNAFNFGNERRHVDLEARRRRPHKHPKDAKAWRDLATALEQKQRTQDAMTRPRALHRAAPEGPERARRARLPVRHARDQLLRTTTQRAQQQMADAGVARRRPSRRRRRPRSGRRSPSPTALQDPISAAVASSRPRGSRRRYSSYQSAQRSAESAYQQLVAPEPEGRDVADPARPGGAGRPGHDRRRSRPTRRS